MDVIRGSESLTFLEETRGGVGSVVVSPTNSLTLGRFGSGIRGGSINMETHQGSVE